MKVDLALGYDSLEHKPSCSIRGSTECPLTNSSCKNSLLICVPVEVKIVTGILAYSEVQLFIFGSAMLQVVEKLISIQQTQSICWGERRKKEPPFVIALSIYGHYW